MALIFLIVAIVLGIKYKKAAGEIVQLTNRVNELNAHSCGKDNELSKSQDKIIESANKANSLESQNQNLKNEIVGFNNKIKMLEAQNQNLKREVNGIEDAKTYLSLLSDAELGLFKYENIYESSKEYQLKQKDIIASEKVLLKEIEKEFSSNLDGKSHKTLFKLLYRCFNAESDFIFCKLTTKNYESQKNKLSKVFDQLNAFADTFDAKLSIDYYKLKMDEMQVAVEYQYKIEAEREEQRAIKEQMREEAKAQAEAEKAIKDAEKKQKAYEKALEKAKRDLAAASSEAKEALNNQIAQLEAQLKDALEKGVRAKSMAQQTKQGHVYVISNIGSFGENVYKIGMTRRLEPMDRVKELGDASVPFKFDVHAMIYSEDAPALENQLHKAFETRRLNKVNNRKEFFKVSLNDIEQTVSNITDAEIQFTKVAEALEFRQSIA
jgi:hypothetical protein